MTAADYPQIRRDENSAGRHYSAFRASRPCAINHLARENTKNRGRIGEVRLKCRTCSMINGSADRQAAEFVNAAFTMGIDRLEDAVNELVAHAAKGEKTLKRIERET